MTNLQQIESLIFLAGDEGISVQTIADVTGFDRPAVLLLLEKLAEKYSNDADSAFEIRESDQVYRMVTKSELADVVKRFFEAPMTQSLSNASLETLAIIAYKQPITRVQTDEIRGVNSSGAIQKLLTRELIQESGRSDTPGRPILYTTTNFFLNYFGLNDLDQLPPLKDIEELVEDRQITGDLFLRALNEREVKQGLEPSEQLPLLEEDERSFIIDDEADES